MNSPTESKVLAIAPKFTAFLSICGSAIIIQKVLRSRRRRRRTMHRIMLGLSVCDILASIWYFAGTWAIPAGTLSWFGDGRSESIFWAAGDRNGVSCGVGGFFNQFAVASPLYNATLAWYFLLTVYYGWDDRRLSKVEWLFHAIPVGYGLLTATFATAADLYGHVEWTCWILPDELFDDTKDLSPVQAKFQWIQWIFLFGVVWVCVFIVTVIFVILYRKMNELETKMRRYSSFSLGRAVSLGMMRGSSDTGRHARKWSAMSFSKNKKVAGLSMVEDGSGDAPVNYSCDMTAFATVSQREQGVVDELFSDNGEPGECTTGNRMFSNRRGSNAGEDQVYIVDSNDTGRDEEFTTKDGDRTVPGANADVRKKRKAVAKIIWLPSYRGRRKRSCSESDGIGRGRSKQFREHSKSRKIAIQGMLYVVAFYITWLFPTISRITELAVGKNFFIIQFFDTFLIPLQGFFNFAIYIRPRLGSYRRSNPEVGFWRALRTVIFEANEGGRRRAVRPPARVSTSNGSLRDSVFGVRPTYNSNIV